MNFYRLPPQRQRAKALEKLIRYIRSCIAPYHPYYRRRFKELGIEPSRLRSYEDILRLPVASKEDFRKDPRAFVLQPKFPGREEAIPYDTERIARRFLLKYLFQALFNCPRDPVTLFRREDLKGKIARRAVLEWLPIHFHATSGTTGEPTSAVYTYYDIHRIIRELAAAAFIRPDTPDPHGLRLEYDNRTMSLFPGAPHLAFFQAVMSKFQAGSSVFDSCGGKVIPTERQIEIFCQGEFNTLGAVPSYLVYWMRKAVEMLEEGRIRPMPHFKGVVLGAEPVSPELKRAFKAMAQKLGAHPRFRVIESLGMTELKWAFFECTEGSGIHLNPKYFFWEVLEKESLEPVGEGKAGVLVFSHIGWRGTTFLRYNSGDLIQGGLVWDRCPHCGYTFPRIFGPICRAEMDFTKIKGTAVPLQDLVQCVRDTEGVNNCQIILEKEAADGLLSRDQLILRVVPEGGCDPQELAHRLRKKVRQRFEVTPDRIVFEEDRERFERELFQKTGVKAEYIVERRPLHI